jgi:hypothetical protein
LAKKNTKQKKIIPEEEIEKEKTDNFKIWNYILTNKNLKKLNFNNSILEFLNFNFKENKINNIIGKHYFLKKLKKKRNWIRK